MLRFSYIAAALWIMSFTAPALAAADWKHVEQIIGTGGSLQPGDVYKIGLPRRDLTVKVDGITVKPSLGLGGWLAFKEEGSGAMVMGDLVLTQEEVAPVMQQLSAGGFDITAIHNHLLRASPFPMYMHLSGHGDPIILAKVLHAALVKTHTPLGPAKKSASEKLPLDTATLDTIIGMQGKAEGGVYKFAIPRKEKIMDGGMEIPPSMGMASSIGFQPVGKNTAAIHGDLVLIAEEVEPVLRVLQENGIDVTALHNHMINEQPRLFFMHFWAVGHPQKLAHGMRAALDKMNIQGLKPE